MLPIAFQIIWLVRSRPHLKYTRIVYPYINGSFKYSYPVQPSSKPIIKLYSVSRYLPLPRRLLYSVYVSSFSVHHSKVGMGGGGGYPQIPLVRLLGCRHIIQQATLLWKPPIALLIWGVTTHIYDPNSNIAWTIAFKLCQDSPSQTRTRDSRAHLFLDFWFFSTSSRH